MGKNKQLSVVIVGICIAISLLFVGYFIFKGLKSFSDKERVVSVRGLSEKIVDADYANLRIKYTEGDNNMQALLKKIEDNNNKIIGALCINVDITKYIDMREELDRKSDEEINLSVPIIKDKMNTEYNDNYTANSFRYYCEVTIVILSSKVENVRKIELSQFDLYKQGITLSQSRYEYDSDSKYSFTKLNDIKPKMIEENERLQESSFLRIPTQS